MRRLALALLLAIFAVLPGCTCNKQGDGRPKVAVSIFPIYDLVRRVAGPDADATLLLPPGQSEHVFDPKAKDIQEAAKAKLGVMIGLNLDPWMEKLVKDASSSARLLKLGDLVKTMTIEEEHVGEEEAHADVKPDDDDHDEKGATDPHVWLDPENAIVWAKAIGDELAIADPPHAQGYRDRAGKLAESLAALDAEVLARTKALTHKGFISFHGSFSYFAKRYGLTIVAVIEPYPGSSPKADYIRKVVGVVKEKSVPALFSEPQLDPKPAHIIAAESRIPLGVLDPVGGSPETDTYEKLIRFDVDSLEKFLK